MYAYLPEGVSTLADLLVVLRKFGRHSPAVGRVAAALGQAEDADLRAVTLEAVAYGEPADVFVNVPELPAGEIDPTPGDTP